MHLKVERVGRLGGMSLVLGWLSLCLGCGESTSHHEAGGDPQTVRRIPANPDRIPTIPEPLDGGVVNPYPAGPSWVGGKGLDLCAAWDHTCAILVDRQLACWGRGVNPSGELSSCQEEGFCGQTSPPSGSFAALACGQRHTCALDTEGNAVCFGAGQAEGECVDNVCGQSLPPDGRFVAIAAGFDFGCALDVGGMPTCWGGGLVDSRCVLGDCSSVLPPLVAFTEIASGDGSSCGIDGESRVRCWGDIDGLPDPGRQYVEVATRRNNGCAIESEGAIRCWTDASYPVVAEAPSGRFVKVAMDRYWACAIAEVGHNIVCWGQPKGDNLNAPIGSYTQLAIGDAHGCAIRDDQAIVCWGSNSIGQAGPPT